MNKFLDSAKRARKVNVKPEPNATFLGRPIVITETEHFGSKIDRDFCVDAVAAYYADTEVKLTDDEIEDFGMSTDPEITKERELWQENFEADYIDDDFDID